MKKSLVYTATLLSFGLAGMLSVGGCGKPPAYADEPTVEFKSFKTGDTVQQSTGITTFVIGFTDGDGDLGTDESGRYNLLIIDERRSDTIYYQIPVIPKQGAADGISGDIEVDMAQICCIDPGLPIACNPIPNTYQTVTYRILIQDNAGHWSNATQTTPLYVKCFE